MSKISQMLMVIEDATDDPLCPAYGRAMLMLTIVVLMMPVLLAWWAAEWAYKKARAWRG